VVAAVLTSVLLPDACGVLQEQADSLKLQLDAQQKAVDQLIANTR